jgi:hypothetical protein
MQKIYAIVNDMNLKQIRRIIQLTLPATLILTSSLNSQKALLPDEIINMAEHISSSETNPEYVAAYIERLSYLAEDPVSINSHDEDEISRLFFLTRFQVRAIADYVKSTGKIISVYEIGNIPGFNEEITEMIIPFITLEEKIKEKSRPLIIRNNLLNNFIYRKGYSDEASTGSALKILTKYRITGGDFTGGFTFEKDQGEKLLNGNPPVPDFLSAHIAYHGEGLIKSFILGDYSICYGQGTGINSGFGMGLSLTSQDYTPAKDQLKPYRSTDENNFFRGVAVRLSRDKYTLFLFLSGNYVDATLGPANDYSEDHIKSFYKGGLHNSASLMSKKDNVLETTKGAVLSASYNNYEIGLALTGTSFSLPVRTDNDLPEYTFDFQGDRSAVFTIYHNWLIGRILLSSELSADNNRKLAFVQVINLKPADRFNVKFMYRRYDPGYFSSHGRGPGTGSATDNEEGISGRFTFEAAKHLFISGGCDIHHYPWLKYRCSSPARGKRHEVRIRYIPDEELEVDLLYKNVWSMFNGGADTGIPERDLLKTSSFKGTVRYRISERIKMITRIDYKIAYPSRERGMLILQDMNYAMESLPLSFRTRYCIFRTDGWDSRIYTYENDLLYSLSIPALSGRGSRCYLMLIWNVRDFADIRFKYGLSTKWQGDNRAECSDEIKLQIRAIF